MTIRRTGPWAAQPPSGSHTTMVVFRSDVSMPAAFAAVAAIDARVVWADPSNGLLALDDASAGRAWQLYRTGALLVGIGPFAGGCVSWVRT